ncbi:conjugal transfer protein TraF (plasmid) [Xanthomonas citri pv. citri]|uniref:conjugal transfer protein TraF n=1 Tax=Xanthomonas citri TaxID=346 RepID=UPI001934786A|nr:conjugal transfer protein TraF [Xanthomonas citri]QRD67174.1 conjugal transfer protein TraF [Xanthomonas citri pv. citri]
MAPKPKPKPGPSPQPPAKTKDTPLSVEWIRNNIDRLRDQAINNPTKENVEMFLYVHKYMMDLSERFAYTYRSVAEGNMALDETIANPVTAVSRRQISDATEKAQDQIINRLAGQVGIWYFFQSTCSYCLKQNPILDFMLQDAPLSILPISLDGLPMVDGSHSNWVVDTGQAQQLQVSTTPTLFLVNPSTNEVVLLAAGLRALPELKQRFVEVAYHQKWISKVEYETAMHGLPRRLLTDGVELQEVRPGTSDRELLEILRSGGIHGGPQTTRSEDEGGNTPWRSN